MNLYSESIGTGRDLVLLHGWAMNAAVWSGIRQRLAQGYRVTVIELPGHGASGYAGSMARMDQWVAACLQAAPARASWVGWSLGGQLAARAAMLAPQRVERLLTLASSPRFVRGDGWRKAMPEPTLRQFADTLRADPHQTLSRFLSLQVQGDDQARQTLRRLRKELERRPEPDALALQHGLELLLQVDLRTELQAMEPPSLWLLGERDSLVPAAVAPELAALLGGRGEVRVLAGCAHAPFLSHPAESLSVLESFLEQGDG